MSRWAGIRTNVEVEAGVIGRKGPISVIASPERIFIAVTALDPETVASEFDIIETLIEDELHFPSRENAKFYEFIVDATISGEGNPLEAIQRLNARQLDLGTMSNILGFDAVPFGLRFAHRGASPPDRDWTDFRLEPTPHATLRDYTFHAIFRRGQRDPVVTFVRDLETTLSNLIAALEGRSQ